MKVSIIQMNSGEDKEWNLAEAKRLMTEAVQKDHPDWLLLPETFDYMGSPGPRKAAAAEEVPGGPAYLMCQAFARDNKVFVHAGSIHERIPGDTRTHNTTVVFDRQGQEVARYRKIHLFDVTAPDGAEYKESAGVKPGDAVVTYDCEGTTVGCAICYDLRFPELFQALAKKGAQVIALPAAFTMQTGKDHWEVLGRARAIETETYFCASGQTGTYNAGNEKRHTYGHSMVIDPWGHVVAKASDGIGVVSTRIDTANVKKVRQMIPVHQHKVAMLNP